MARKPARNFIPIPRGYPSAEAASFVAQLDDLTACMMADLGGLGARELSWQPGPGRNSIGMLLAHCALVEAAWIGGPAIGSTEVDFMKIVGIGRDDDGIPAPPDGRHPRALRGWELADYAKLLRRSRAFVRRHAKRWTPGEIEKPLTRFWRSQDRIQHYHRRWILYHLVEHLAGHYGQMLLLKELMKQKRGRRPA